MAVASSADVSPARTTADKKRKNSEQEEVEAPVVPNDSNQDQVQDSALENPKQPKRNKAPGVRVVGGRVYDSSNGKTCHQCRQKTLDFTADCKNMKKNKQCTMKLCHKCLLNRYGEKAEEVALLDDWKCPKCRGICNCSFCMKKRGCQPTGMLIHNAKASGYNSVSELLHVQSPTGSLSREEIAKSVDDTIASAKKVGKENKLNAANNKISETHSKKGKRIKDLNEKNEVNGVQNVSEANNEEEKLSTETSEVNNIKRKISKKMKKVKEAKESTEIGDTEKGKLKELAEVSDADRRNHALSNGNEPVALGEASKKKAKLNRSDNEVINEEPKEVKIILPTGNELTNVAELDLLPEDVGNVLQLIEFCYTFGEVLDIREGQVESVLRDMRLGRNKRGKVPSVVQFKIHLLTLIREDMGEDSPLSPTDGKDCWLHALKEYVSESKYVAKDLAALNIDRTDTYEMLSFSEKLKLLVFLCDETLDTLQVRNWMEEENEKFAEKKKEAKEKMLAVKEKQKLAKRNLQDEVAKAIIAKNGAPMSIAEHEALVSELKAETELANAEMLEAKALLPDDFTPDAVRIKPAFIDSNGHLCWRLKGFNKTEFLRQEIQSRDDSKASDKWFSYDEEKDTQLIKEYISSSRIQRRKYRKRSVPKKMRSPNPQTDCPPQPTSPGQQEEA